MFFRSKCVCLVHKTHRNQGSRQHRVDTSWTQRLVMRSGLHGMSNRKPRASFESHWIMALFHNERVFLLRHWVFECLIAFCRGYQRWLVATMDPKPCPVSRLCWEGPHAPPGAWGRPNPLAWFGTVGRHNRWVAWQSAGGTADCRPRKDMSVQTAEAVPVLGSLTRQHGEPKLARFVSFTHIRVQDHRPVLA